MQTQSIKSWWVNEAPDEVSNNVKDRLAKQAERVQCLMASSRLLTPTESVEAWHRFRNKLVDVGKWNNDANFVWENFESADESPVPVLPQSPEFVLLLEGFPTIGLVSSDRSAFVEMRSHLPDLYLLPWPRLNAVTAITHELGIGPYHLHLGRTVLRGA